MNDFEVVRSEALIIGAGAAGLRVAIELIGGGVQPLVIGKRRHGDAHTAWAAGGINASLGTRDPEDRPEIHAADTIREGHFICDPRAVELLARDAPERVRELHAWGCDFHLHEREIDQRYFGAQSFRRTCFVGDVTGRAMLDTLVAKARELEVPYRQNLMVTRILVADGRAVGAFAVDLETGGGVLLESPVVVVAAAGHTSIYARSSSRPDENTGDAAALALEAGARLRDMELVQFHPTGRVDPPELRGRLVTEAVRGEGGHLLNAQGERFMERYSPEHMELDARDVVARAIYTEVEEGRGTPDGAVLLDISHRGRAFLEERLPAMLKGFAEAGIDIASEPMPVAPTAHYAMGGIRVDFDSGATDVPGLYAVGEATAGVHGANRLGGNSLAETVVFGCITGRHLLDARDEAPPAADARALGRDEAARLERLARADGQHEPRELTEELRTVMWRHAGIVRNESLLREGLRQLASLRERSDSLAVRAGTSSDAFVAALNLRFMLLVARTVLEGALLRRESRGAHYRDDAPERDDEHWRTTILYRLENDAIVTETAPVGDVHPGIRRALDEEHALDYHHLE
jgi:succinate dehydrogenase / fumarate reductase, flavoprotein subunit